MLCASLFAFADYGHVLTCLQYSVVKRGWRHVSAPPDFSCLPLSLLLRKELARELSNWSEKDELSDHKSDL